MKDLRLRAFCDCSILTTLYKISQGHLILLGTNCFHVEAKNERFTAASVLRLLHLDHLVQNKPRTLNLAWHELFSC